MFRPAPRASRVLTLAALAALVGTPRAASAWSPEEALDEADKTAKKVRRALDTNKYEEAATLTFQSVEKLRREAAAVQAEFADDRETLESAACLALRMLARLDEQPSRYATQIETRNRLQALCKPRDPAPTPGPTEPVQTTPAPTTPVTTTPATTTTNPPTPPTGPVEPTPKPTTPVATPLRTAAIVTGALGGALVISAGIMTAVAARPGDAPDCAARGCPVGSYGKAYAAAQASVLDDDPNNDVPHGADDHVCAAGSRAVNDAVDAACRQRGALKAGAVVSYIVGGVLIATAVATGVLHHRRTKQGDRPRLSLQPAFGRTWMMSATLHF